MSALLLDSRDAYTAIRDELDWHIQSLCDDRLEKFFSLFTKTPSTWHLLTISDCILIWDLNSCPCAFEHND
jgi:hypothetical protein